MVYDHLRDRTVESRIGLVRATGLSKATMTQIIDEFIAEGFVEEIGPGASHRGRRPTLLRFAASSRYAIGVELGDTASRAVLTNLNSETLGALATTYRPTTADNAVEAAAELVAALTARVPPAKLLGIGVGTPGLVDSQCGVIRIAPDLGWKNVSVGAQLAERFRVPVACLNRAKASAWGEAWCGAGEKADNLVYISVSTGISAGIVLNRHLYRGVSMSEGEIGHVTLLPDGPLCACGNRGCLQTVAAGPAILARVRERLRATGQALVGVPPSDIESVSLEAVGHAAAEGDKLVEEILLETADFVGIAASNLVNTLNPRMLVFGGSVIRALPSLTPLIGSVIRRRALSVPASAVEVVTSRLGRDTVTIGAAAFLLSQISPVASDGVHSSDGHHAVSQIIYPNGGPQNVGGYSAANSDPKVGRGRR
jgi:predicted NBD/HSP70 family sugar kinase